MDHEAIAIPPLPQDLRAIPRVMLADTIERLLAELDARDGDPDLEETDAEDSFVLSWYANGERGPGCRISDPDYAVDDLPCDAEAEDGL